MPQIFANNATSTLSATLTSGGTSLLVQPGHGARFPTIAGTDFAYCTLEDSSGNVEIVKVTAHAASAQAFTIERAQQGTTARAWAVGDLFELRFTAEEANGWSSDIAALQSSRSIKTGQAYSGAHDFTGATVTVAPAVAANSPMTKAQAEALAFSAALPAQAGNSGCVLMTNGAAAFWADPSSTAALIEARALSYYLAGMN